MIKDDLLAQLERLTVWRRRGERAPHKPLLILLALGRFARGETSLPFQDLEPELVELLREFGPARKSVHPEYPFWRLQRDGLWEVHTTGTVSLRTSNSDPTVRSLRSTGATGRFPVAVQRALSQKPQLLSDMAQVLLEANFPESVHEDILTATGLTLLSRFSSRRPRDPGFRSAVLKAYEHKCTVCGLDLRIGNRTVAVEAAHIRWHQVGGPDDVTNGLALCSLHHKLFDLGAMAIDNELRIVVSDEAHGGTQWHEVLLRHHGEPIRRPVHAEQVPDKDHVLWHRAQVFKGRPRFIADELRR